MVCPSREESCEECPSWEESSFRKLILLQLWTWRETVYSPVLKVCSTVRGTFLLLNWKNTDLKGVLFIGGGSGWMVTTRELWSMSLCPRGGWWWVVPPRGLSWDAFQHLYEWHRRDEVHLHKFADDQQAEWCSWFNRRKGCHPVRPGQAWRVGPCEPDGVQQGQVQGIARMSGQFQTYVQIRRKNHWVALCRT